jgi:hypothetical protein
MATSTTNFQLPSSEPSSAKKKSHSSWPTCMLKKETAGTSRTSVIVYPSTRRHVSADFNQHMGRWDSPDLRMSLIAGKEGRQPFTFLVILLKFRSNWWDSFEFSKWNTWIIKWLNLSLFS